MASSLRNMHALLDEDLVANHRHKVSEGCEHSVSHCSTCNDDGSAKDAHRYTVHNEIDSCSSSDEGDEEETHGTVNDDLKSCLISLFMP